MQEKSQSMRAIARAKIGDKLLLAAHRGEQSEATENTLKAFADAIALGVDMIETDLHITRDGRIVLYHNATITDGNKKHNISSLSYDEIQKIELIDPKRNERISLPELSELLSLAKDKCLLNIEVKHTAGISNEVYIDTIFNYVSKYGDFSQSIFASFDYEILAKCRSINPEVFIAGIRIPTYPLTPKELSDMIGIDAYITSLSTLNKQMKSECEERGIILGAYSIDTKEHFNKAMRYGVQAMGSNKPRDVKKYIDDYNNKLSP